MDNFFQLIEKRYSCRYFTGEAVPYETALKCVEAARLAPSACNSQPWHFIIVSKKEHLSKVSKCFQDYEKNKFTDKAGAFIIATEEGKPALKSLGSVINAQKFKALDLGIACSYIVLAATELNLGSCILGSLNERKLRTLLSIPKDRRVRFAVALGIKDKNAPPYERERKDISEILDKETYK